jgi:hypothetical protein
MARVLLPLLALERFIVHARAMLADLKRSPSEKELAMVEWLEGRLKDYKTDPITRVAREIGRLRPGWDRQMTAMEMHELHGALETLQDFTAGEWETIRLYLAYKPRAGEKLYQVNNRLWFMQNPVNTLTAAECWRRDNEKRKPVHSSLNSGQSSYSDTSMESDVKAMAADIFKDFHAKCGQPANNPESAVEPR